MTNLYIYFFFSQGGSRGNIGYRVVQQQPMALNDDDDDENLEALESSDDERAGYPTLPAEGLGSRPSINSLRHVSCHPFLLNIQPRSENVACAKGTVKSREQFQCYFRDNLCE